VIEGSLLRVPSSAGGEFVKTIVLNNVFESVVVVAF